MPENCREAHARRRYWQALQKRMRQRRAACVNIYTSEARSRQQRVVPRETRKKRNRSASLYVLCPRTVQTPSGTRAMRSVRKCVGSVRSGAVSSRGGVVQVQEGRWCRSC